MTWVQDGDTQWLYFTHNMRADDDALIYTVEFSSNLESDSWTTEGVEIVEVSEVIGDFKTVTSRVMVGDRGFLRLRVEME